MFAAGRILRQSRRLSSLPGAAVVPPVAKLKPKERRKFRCYMPFMWSALVMTLFGITIIVTGTAMCVAGWYLGHFADYGTRTLIKAATTNTSAGDGAPSVEELPANILPARGLAYAGPVVMSFGCFAVVFACVVVCETRDRIIETMDNRVSRGLPARPPGGIDADFYSLVVEFRKRRAEKQRRRRKLLLRDDVSGRQPEVGRPATPPEVTPTTEELQTPSTVNFFVDDPADLADESEHLPAGDIGVLRRTGMAEDELNGTLRSARSSLSDSPCFTPAEVDFRPVTLPPAGPCLSTRLLHPAALASPGQFSKGRLLWSSGSSVNSSFRPCSSPVRNETFAESSDPPRRISLAVPPRFTSNINSDLTQSQFPLLAPISSLATSTPLPYVRLEVGDQFSTPGTSFVHTASVHAERSPDVVASFEFPTPDLRLLTSGIDPNTRSCGNDTNPNDFNLDSGNRDSPRNRMKSRDFADADTPVREQPSDMATADSSHSFCGTDDLSAAHIQQTALSLSAPACYQSKRPHHISVDDVQHARVDDADRVGDAHSTENCPQMSSAAVADECGPSRKRPRASPPLPVAVDSRPSLSRTDHLTGLEAALPPGSQHPADYLISKPAGSTWEAERDYARSCHSAAESSGKNADVRRPNRIRHSLSGHRRRRRHPPTPTSGLRDHNAPRSDDEELDRAAAPIQHSADELEIHQPSSLSDGSIADDASRLVWLRRRTTTTVSPQQLQTTDAVQSTV